MWSSGKEEKWGWDKHLFLNTIVIDEEIARKKH